MEEDKTVKIKCDHKHNGQICGGWVNKKKTDGVLCQKCGCTAMSFEIFREIKNQQGEQDSSGS